jgi:lipopolysaccharide export system permease protein
MRLLTRYLLRQLWAPFTFALTALTGFMLLNQVAKRFGNLVGKGLPWHVIGEVFGLSIPFIVAMTLPMAVLVTVLYVLSRLAADSEVTAMRASGLGLGRLVTPLLIWGVAMAAVDFAFVDQVLPRTNARLRNLLIDINRKKPTFALREQAINEIPPSQLFLRALRIEPGTGRLRGIAIYDLGDQQSRRVIYADSGVMGYAPNGTDLSLRLFHGSVHQLRGGEPEVFQVSAFSTNEIRVRDVFDKLTRGEGVARGDRELSTCEMLAVIDSADADAKAARLEHARLVRQDLYVMLGLPAPTAPAAADTALRLPGYCRWMGKVGALLLPKTAHAQSRAQARKPDAAAMKATADSADSATRAFASRPRMSSWTESTASLDRERDAMRRAARFEVEVHKKWSISMACIPFVLVGITLALRFPRAGMGIVIGGGFAVFSLYYIGLTAGESLADRGLMSPWLSMWLPNIVFLVVGAVGLALVSREMGSTRGGDFGELAVWLRTAGRRLRRRRDPA